MTTKDKATRRNPSLLELAQEMSNVRSDLLPLMVLTIDLGGALSVSIVAAHITEMLEPTHRTLSLSRRGPTTSM